MVLSLLKLMEGNWNQSFPLLYQVQCSTGCCISNCIFLDGSERSEKTTLVKKLCLVSMVAHSISSFKSNRLLFRWKIKKKFQINLKKTPIEMKHLVHIITIVFYEPFFSSSWNRHLNIHYYPFYDHASTFKWYCPFMATYHLNRQNFIFEYGFIYQERYLW